METLVKIQNELKVPKGNINKFGNYKYRSAEDILEAVKPILLKYSAILVLSDKVLPIGNKIFLKATAELIISDKSVVSFGYAETSEHKGMSAEQTTGTASSYARKYALNGLFLIDETEQDADSQKPKEELKKELPVKESNPKTLEEYKSFIFECDHVFNAEEKSKFITGAEGWNIKQLQAAFVKVSQLRKEREEKLQSENHNKQLNK